MGIVSWEKRPDGQINVWDSPIRWVGRKRVIKNPDAFFNKVKSLSPFSACGLVQGDYGFCADPGVFTSTNSFIEKSFNELEKNIMAMIDDWRPVHINAAKDAMMEIAPEDFEHNQKMSTWIMKYMKDIFELDSESAINAHELIHDSETGYQALTRRHNAATLRNLMEYGISHTLRIRDFLRIIGSLHVGSAFKVEIETMVVLLNDYIELRYDIDDHVRSHSADKRVLKERQDRMKRAQQIFIRSKVYELVNGRHPRLGRHGTAYTESIRGLRHEAERALVLTRLVREQFADVIDVLGVDQVLGESALD